MIARRHLLRLAMPALIAPGVLMPVSSRVAPRVWRCGHDETLDPVFHLSAADRRNPEAQTFAEFSLEQNVVRPGDILEYRNPLLPVVGRWMIVRRDAAARRLYEIEYLGVRAA